MVEGPGATRNAQKIQRIVGWKVDKAFKKKKKKKKNENNNNYNYNNNHTAEELSEFSKLQGCILNEAFCVGKEVFLCFDNDNGNDDDGDNNNNNSNNKKNIAIRLHFGMNGSLWIRNDTATTSAKAIDPWKKKDISFVLRVVVATADRENQQPQRTSSMILETSGSTSICTTSVRIARGKRERLRHLDVCGDSFQVDRVLAAVKTRPESMISDVLLDQDKVPGVGNIIKIEGLHRAGIHPRRLVSSLNDGELMSVIQACQDYAWRWFRHGSAPTKQVYNMTTCGSCKNPSIRIVKLGDDLRRVTFWCEKCQPFSTSSSSSRLSNNNINNNNSLNSGRNTDDRRNIGCPQHGEVALLLRRVRKETSIHRQRLFYTCSNKRCQYFQWADGHLPSCRCGKKCTMKISKTERTGGRWFLACCQNICGHFAWASPDQIIAFGPQLTPLR